MFSIPPLASYLFTNKVIQSQGLEEEIFRAILYWRLDNHKLSFLLSEENRYIYACFTWFESFLFLFSCKIFMLSGQEILLLKKCFIGTENIMLVTRR